jgi:hypothetical protein
MIGVCTEVERNFDALDVEARYKLREHCIYGLVLSYKVIRFCREREMLSLLGLRIRRIQIGRKANDARRP